MNHEVIYGSNAEKSPPEEAGTYLAYDTDAKGWMLVDYNPGSSNEELSGCTDWSTSDECIPYTRAELAHLYWYPLPGKRQDPRWEVINHEGTPEREPWEERLYHCPRCDMILGQSCHSHYIFGHSSVLQNNKFPNFCPHCGLQIQWYGTRLPESFFEED